MKLMADGVGRRRRSTVDAVVGVVESDGRLELPAVELDTYFTMRRVPAELRAGFRAWISEQDHGGIRRRALAEWDRLRGVFAASPLT